MKCPKCDYLGFDTGDRCRNCGYDFSLISTPVPPAPTERVPDFDLHLPDREPPSLTPSWAESLDRALAEQAKPFEPPQPPPAFRGEPVLPLFGPGAPNDDEPLVKLPATPRAPLAVRRTPDTPRLRAVARHQREIEPTLEFRDDDDAPGTPAPAPSPSVRTASAPAAVSGPGSRILAAAVDYLILLAIDLTVVYFTLRLAALDWAEWSALPPVPMITFLVLIQLAYFAAFTAFGGQTIGKMAAGIRVVGDDNRLVDPGCAVRRTLLGAVSLFALGLGLLPVLFGGDRRALHDRIAHTRVVAQTTA